MSVRNVILKAKINDQIVELMAKSQVTNIYLEDGVTTLASKLTTMATDISNKMDSDDVTQAISEAVEALIGVEGDDSTKNTLYGIRAAIKDLDNSLASVAKSGNAADVSIADTAGKITATNVEDAIAELAVAIENATTAGTVTVVKSTEVEGVAARYTFSQGGQAIPNAVIDIPKDMVVESGTVVTNPEGQPEGTYLKLVLANADEDVIYINVSTLIEYVTSGSQAGDTVFITIDPITHKVTADITDGTVAKAKLASDVQTSLGKADTAVQSVTVLGQVLENGDELTADQAKAALGLGSAAYEDKTAFDAAGAASTVKTELVGTADDTKDSATIEGAKKYADNINTTLSGRIDDLEGATHTHANKTVLNGITAEVVAEWNSKGTTFVSTIQPEGFAEGDLWLQLVD